MESSVRKLAIVPSQQNCSLGHTVPCLWQGCWEPIEVWLRENTALRDTLQLTHSHAFPLSRAPYGCCTQSSDTATLIYWDVALSPVSSVGAVPLVLGRAALLSRAEGL